jgi:general secretion pathway protein G
MKHTFHFAQGEQGFTLIELLIVVIILAILSAIVVFAVGSTTTNATLSSCKADKSGVDTAMETYKAQEGSYPTSESALTSTFPDPNNSAITDGPWLKELPSNSGYTISVNLTTGAVTSSLAGC